MIRSTASTALHTYMATRITTKHGILRGMEEGGRRRDTSTYWRFLVYLFWAGVQLISMAGCIKVPLGFQYTIFSLYKCGR